jgi:tetratricopeptide (TPR) repeat protein
VRRDLERLKGEIASRRADQLRERGDLAGAWDQLSALLAAYPNEPTLLLAAGRIYAAAGHNEIAMRFVDAAYRQAPGDLGVIRGAVGGAIQAGDTYRARAYLLAGMQLYPNNPRLYYLAAEIHRAEGDNGAAMYHLAVARRLDLGGAGPWEPVAAAVPVAGPAPPGTLPPNPFRQSAAEPSPPSVMPAASQAAETPRGPVMLAAARTAVSATDATPAPVSPSAGSSAPPGAGGEPHVQHAD